MICRIDGSKYDISTKNDWIGACKGGITIAPKCFHNFKSIKDKVIGYADVLYYEISVLSGLKHNIEDYRYKNKIYLSLAEIYKDTDGNEYIVRKLINIGAYIEEKNKAFTMKHLSYGNAGRLVSVEGVVFNNSEFTIKVKDLHLYKSVTYSNSGSGSNDYDILPDASGGIHIDDVGGERTEPFKVWSSFAYTYSHMNHYNDLFKEGDEAWWSTADFWTLKLRAITWNNNGTVEGSKLTSKIYTDKNQLIELAEDDTFNIPNYTEYLYINSVDKDGDSKEHIIYTNALGLYYGGSAEKYHRLIDGASKTGRVWYNDAKDKYTEFFESRNNYNELGILSGTDDESNTIYNKYLDLNFDGVRTLQLAISYYDTDEHKFKWMYKNMYWSTQPFVMKQIRNANQDSIIDLSESVPVVIKHDDGQEWVYWVLPNFLNSVAGSVDVKSVTSQEYDSNNVDYPPDVAVTYFRDAMINACQFVTALEDR